jgi:hypothetical protein
MSGKTFRIAVNEHYDKVVSYEVEADSAQEALNKYAVEFSDLEPVATEYPDITGFDVIGVE